LTAGGRAARSDEHVEERMGVITTEKLGASVGAEVKGVDMERLLHDDGLPAACLDALQAHTSGRTSLVLGATSDHVIGMGAHEGRARLDELLARSTTRDRVHRHEWSVGDVVIWDNRGVLHRACPYDPISPRDVHRTTLAGDEPIQ
jgi:hypothetical protein